MTTEFEWRVGEKIFWHDLVNGSGLAALWRPFRQYNKIFSSSKTAVVLKLVTAVLGIQTILTAWDTLALSDYAAIFSLSFLYMPAIIIVWLAFIINNGKRPRRRLDPSGSWKLFAVTVLVRQFVFSLANFVW